MKRGTPEHPKTEDLAMRLNIPVAHAVGLLEMLWHFAAKFALQGDIGRFSDEMIAKKSGWEGDPECFISALLESTGGGAAGFIERHEKYRLVIHDWSEHAEQSVRKTLANRGLKFWNDSGNVPEMDGNFPDDSIPRARGTAYGKGKGKGNGREGDSKGGTEPKRFDAEAGFVEFWTAYPKTPRKVEKAKCRDRYKRCVQDDASTHSVLMDRLREDIRKPDWQKNGGEFICAPLVWLNRKRWLDDPMEAEPGKEKFTCPKCDSKHTRRSLRWGESEDGSQIIYYCSIYGCNAEIMREDVVRP